MNQACPFCQTNVTPLRIGGVEFRICTKCHSTFLLSSQFSTLRRDVDEESRRKWTLFLKDSATRFVPATNPVCMEHGHPLVQGTLPDVVVPGLTATCCTLMHLDPATLGMLLERSLRTPSANFSDLRKTRRSGFFKGLFERFDKSADVDDGLGGAAWEMKIKPVLTAKS